jgi:uncharacterized damage-inducible protein DinB
MTMTMTEALLAEFDEEAENTRKALERIPDDKLDYKPHPKSGSMGWLVTHLANIPAWTVRALQQDSFDFSPAGAPPQRTVPLTSIQEVLSRFDNNVTEARTALTPATDEALLQPWTLLSGGREVFSMARGGVIRNMVMNHSIHHRGQLTVYMRLNDIPVPGLYGASADEK